MTITEDSLLWALGQLGRLSIFKSKGFPVTDAEKITVARAFLRILADQEGNEFEEDGGSATGVVKTVVPSITAMQSGEQLVDEIVASCEWFPLPVEMRKIYKDLNFTPEER